MPENHSQYISPLASRYASKEMQYLFSEEYKLKTFRKLWIILAESEKELGLNITDKQIEELKAHQDDIDYEVIKEKEKEIRHDVMANIYAYSLLCPNAKGIIHLGATSCYVDDNTDALIIKNASQIILNKAIQVLANLKKFALDNKKIITLGYTHLQPASLTTVGKRATLWMNELLIDINNLIFQINNLKPRGIKGATGTLASFLDLFEGDKDKVRKLEKLVVNKMGFSKPLPVSGQTYTRKIDANFTDVLAGIATSAYKFSDDLRILQSFGEIEEPFEKKQVGSSAMPYKRNPMRAERLSSLSRYVIVESMNSNLTAATQFLERTLDDSANRRLTLSECFLTVDAILNIYINITDGLVVNKATIKKRIDANLPFIACENIMMEACKKGQDRQKIHEIIRTYSQKCQTEVRQGKKNNLLKLIIDDKNIPLNKEEIASIINPVNFIGLSVEQTNDFIKEYINPLLKMYHKEEIKKELEL